MMELKIAETLEILVQLDHEDWPDQFAESRFDAMEQGLADFVRRVADRHSASQEEERALTMAVAMRLLELARSNRNYDLLRRRMADNPNRRIKHENDEEGSER